MNRLIYCLLLVVVLGCQKTLDKSVEKVDVSIKDEPNYQMTAIELEEHQKKYRRLKKEISETRLRLKKRTDIDNDKKLELAEDYISKILIDSVFEYWAGTQWDFNGYTETPRKGLIACGYYISTPLRDIGVNLNRFKMAQKSAEGIVKQVCHPNSIQTISDLAKLIAYMQVRENGEILILGLSNHVGFVFKRNDEIYFAHSNYIGSKGVEKEKLETSRAINASNIYVIGQLTKDQAFVKKWLEGQRIQS